MFIIEPKNTNTPFIVKIREKFNDLFQTNPSVIARAPGRAEIIGNHTDYNHGYALGAAISNSTFAAIARSKDDIISLFSDAFDTKPTSFSLNELKEKKDNHWTNYVKAVACELAQKKSFTKGFNLLISSDVPISGGVSSSAALELAVGLSLSHLCQINLTTFKLASLCQRAENGPLVNSPCGFLDQAIIALAKQDNLIFLDFLPKDDSLVSMIEHIPIRLNKHNVSLVVVVDKTVKRNLGESGYPARRKLCEQSLLVFSKLLRRKIQSLRNVSADQFEKYKNKLERIDRKMRMRVQHIVYENQRVLDAVQALKGDNIRLFGKLLTESGKSALELYELDEQTPELTFLIEKARDMKGVLGARNMGGGFSANILVLIKNSSVETFTTKLISQYAATYQRKLDFIIFQPRNGAEICYSNQ